MRKKFLATLMAVCMVIGITACGQEPASSSSSIGTQESEETESYVESSVEESIVESESSHTESVEDAESAEESSEGGEKVLDDQKMILCAWWDYGDGEGYAIFNYDPENGDYQEISQFSYRQEVYGYYYESPLISYHPNRRDRFSNDFSKVAVSCVDANTKAYRAGWVDVNGNFFDVPEALGINAENEFVAQPDYYSIGFTKNNNYFVFAELPDNKRNIDGDYLKEYGKFYYVSLDDFSVAHEGNPLQDETANESNAVGFTDWINDAEYLSNYDGNSVIRNINNPDMIEEYIAAEARRNWGGIVGPDGMFAFSSAPKQGHGDMAVYVINRDGSGLQRIFSCDSIASYGGRDINHLHGVYILSWE